MVSVRSAVYDLRQCRTRLEKILGLVRAGEQLSPEADLAALASFIRYLEEIYADQAAYDDSKAEWSSQEEDLESSTEAGDHF